VSSDAERLRTDLVHLGTEMEARHQAVRQDVDALRTNILDLQSEISRLRADIKDLADLVVASGGDASGSSPGSQLSWLGVLGAVIVGGLIVRYCH
jgi:outer membrane murein-binding lipoprotein Lpp